MTNAAAKTPTPAGQLELLEAVLAATPEHVAVLDRELRYVYVNRAALDYWDRTAAHVLGSTWRDLGHRPAVMEPVAARMREVFRSGTPCTGEMLDPTGRTDGSFAYTLRPLCDEAGEVQRIVATCREITARKQAEAEIARVNGELTHVNQELERFWHVASHDLQESLRNIMIFGNRLDHSHRAKLGQEGANNLDRMVQAAKLMSEQIKGLLALSHIASRPQMNLPVHLTQIVRDVVVELQPELDALRGRVDYGALPSIHADPLQMRQLFQHLLGNALKFRRPDAPPVLHVDAREIDAEMPGDAPARPVARIVVRDNGIGFADKHRERIFEAFHRLHPPEAYPGTGVGLAICRRIVEMHGGTITAEGTPGQGAVFTITLPLA